MSGCEGMVVCCKCWRKMFVDFRLILRIVGGRGAPAETLTDALKIHGLDGGSGVLAG